jgi:hypothetical protein
VIASWVGIVVAILYLGFKFLVLEVRYARLLVSMIHTSHTVLQRVTKLLDHHSEEIDSLVKLTGETTDTMVSLEKLILQLETLTPGRKKAIRKIIDAELVNSQLKAIAEVPGR